MPNKRIANLIGIDDETLRTKTFGAVPDNT